MIQETNSAGKVKCTCLCHGQPDGTITHSEPCCDNGWCDPPENLAYDKAPEGMVRCTCRCHEPGSRMKHFVACCSGGWKKPYEDKPAPGTQFIPVPGPEFWPKSESLKDYDNIVRAKNEYLLKHPDQFGLKVVEGQLIIPAKEYEEMTGTRIIHEETGLLPGFLTDLPPTPHETGSTTSIYTLEELAEIMTRRWYDKKEPDPDREVTIGTGKSGAIYQLICMEKMCFELVNHRKWTDAEREEREAKVYRETADWPEGFYMIQSGGKDGLITYNGMSIYKYMASIRKEVEDAQYEFQRFIADR